VFDGIIDEKLHGKKLARSQLFNEKLSSLELSKSLCCARSFQQTEQEQDLAAKF
jgi:hypothetical protein